jgi:hypothetical protein
MIYSTRSTGLIGLVINTISHPPSKEGCFHRTLFFTTDPVLNTLIKDHPPDRSIYEKLI